MVLFRILWIGRASAIFKSLSLMSALISVVTKSMALQNCAVFVCGKFSRSTSILMTGISQPFPSMYMRNVAAVQLARDVARIAKGLKPLFPPPLSTGSSVIHVFSPAMTCVSYCSAPSVAFTFYSHFIKNLVCSSKRLTYNDQFDFSVLLSLHCLF